MEGDTNLSFLCFWWYLVVKMQSSENLQNWFCLSEQKFGGLVHRLKFALQKKSHCHINKDVKPVMVTLLW